MNGGRSDSRRPERSDFRSPAPSFDQNKAQLDAVNAKLDKILSILAPAPVTKSDSGDVKKEVKPEKAKKVVKKTASTKKK